MIDRIAQFSALVEAQPNNALFRFSLAQALLAAGQDNEAEPQLRHCIESKDDWMLPRILLGKLLLKRGDKTAAKPVLENALQLAIDQDHEDPAAELRAILAGW